MEDDEEHYRKLKISLHKSIGTMANSENIKLTPESHLAMVELVFEQCKMFGFDLEAFANHGKRMTINGDDVRLLLRRHPDLLKDL